VSPTAATARRRDDPHATRLSTGDLHPSVATSAPRHQGAQRLARRAVRLCRAGLATS